MREYKSDIQYIGRYILRDLLERRHLKINTTLHRNVQTWYISDLILLFELLYK